MCKQSAGRLVNHQTLNPCSHRRVGSQGESMKVSLKRLKKEDDMQFKTSEFICISVVSYVFLTDV